MIEISIIRNGKTVKEIELGEKAKVIIAASGIITLAILIGLFTWSINYNINSFNEEVLIKCWDVVENSNHCHEVIESSRKVKIFNKAR